MSESIAFLIIAHQEPGHLRRLVLALQAPWARFFIHIDNKVDSAPFQNALSDIPEATLIHNRVDIYWAGWSLVQATLNLLRASFDADASLQRFVLLSGACYPLRSNTALRDFLFADKDEHITSILMPNLDLQKPLSRLTKWHFEGGFRVPGLAARMIRLVNKIALRGPSRNVKMALGSDVPYAGHQWWALTREAGETVLRVTSQRPELVALFKYATCPDESFFQTILANSALSGRIKTCLTFTDWSRPQERPCLIDDGHMSELLQSKFIHSDAFGSGPVFFARKFSSKNAAILDKIDQIRGRF
jgi:hypothetical protein